MASPDLGVFQRGRTIEDFNRLNQEFALKKQAAQQKLLAAQNGSSLPAPLQLANEYQKRLASGDQEGANAIAAFAKTTDKGLTLGEDGNYHVMGGYAPAVAQIAGEKAGASQNAKNVSDAAYKPSIAGASAFQKALGTDRGEKSVALNDAESFLPQLEETAQTLSQLGKTATYTKAGVASDTFTRETGGEVGPGAVARAEYMAQVDNQVLPILRQTFGAQFTENEGKALRATLGDPNKSPTEKDAILKGFIEQKKATIQSMRRAAGVPNADGSTSLDSFLAVQDPIGQGGEPVDNSNMQSNLPAAPVKAPNLVTIEFNLKKKGYTPQQIKDYIKTKGY